MYDIYNKFKLKINEIDNSNLINSASEKSVLECEIVEASNDGLLSTKEYSKLIRRLD